MRHSARNAPVPFGGSLLSTFEIPATRDIEPNETPSLPAKAHGNKNRQEPEATRDTCLELKSLRQPRTLAVPPFSVQGCTWAGEDRPQERQQGAPDQSLAESAALNERPAERRQEGL